MNTRMTRKIKELEKERDAILYVLKHRASFLQTSEIRGAKSRIKKLNEEIQDERKNADKQAS